MLFGRISPCELFFFFNDTATTEIYTLSLHDALPISTTRSVLRIGSSFSTVLPSSMAGRHRSSSVVTSSDLSRPWSCTRSEEHTSELQSQSNLVCRLLLEKKKQPSQHSASRGSHYLHT